MARLKWEFVRNVTRYQMWFELPLWKESLAEGTSGLSEDRASGPHCMKALLTLWVWAFSNTEAEEWGSKPYPSPVLIHLSSVLWQGGNNRNQEGGTSVLFLKQPFQLSLHPTSFPLCNGGKQSLGWGDVVMLGLRCLRSKQNERQRCEGWPRLTWKLFSWNRTWLHLLHWPLHLLSQCPELRTARRRCCCWACWTTPAAQPWLISTLLQLPSPFFWHKLVITQLYLIRFWKKKKCLKLTTAFGFFIKQYTYICVFLLLTYYCGWKSWENTNMVLSKVIQY